MIGDEYVDPAGITYVAVASGSCVPCAFNSTFGCFLAPPCKPSSNESVCIAWVAKDESTRPEESHDPA